MAIMLRANKNRSVHLSKDIRQILKEEVSKSEVKEDNEEIKKEENVENVEAREDENTGNNNIAKEQLDQTENIQKAKEDEKKAEIEPKKDQLQDIDAQLPASLPKEWRELIKATPQAKDILLKQFNNGNKLIYQKASEMDKSIKSVKAYEKALFDGVEHILENQFQGNKPAMFAEVNKFLKALHSPHDWQRVEILRELAQRFLPNGLDNYKEPDPVQRQMLEMMDKFQSQNNTQANILPAQQNENVFIGMVQNLKRFNGQAKEFLDSSPENGRMVLNYYQQIGAANPSMEAADILAEAVNQAIQSKQQMQLQAEEERKRAEARGKAASMSIAGAKKVSPNVATPSTAKEAIVMALNEQRQRGRM